MPPRSVRYRLRYNDDAVSGYAFTLEEAARAVLEDYRADREIIGIPADVVNEAADLADDEEERTRIRSYLDRSPDLVIPEAPE